MTQETKQIKLKPEIFEALNNLKDEDESWNYFFKRLILIPHNSRELKPLIGQDEDSVKPKQRKTKVKDEAACELDKVFQEFWSWVKEQPATAFFKDYKLSVADVQILKAQVKKYGLEKMKNYHQAGINDPFLKENNVPLTFNNMFSNKAIARILATVHKTRLKTDFARKKNQETLEYLRSLNK
jgi:predicted CopG family antitoxin